ncbi:hypothetical protein TAMC210_01020 [Thermanaeromonas sp. C210]|nr:hypothetical protein TAMC210_01020 [Thermanaeromonas sp. C210]
MARLPDLHGLKYEPDRIRSKGQIILPLSVRQAVQADEGDYLAYEVRGDSVILRKAPLYPRTSFDDGIWRLVGSAEDREGREGRIY